MAVLVDRRIVRAKGMTTHLLVTGPKFMASKGTNGPALRRALGAVLEHYSNSIEQTARDAYTYLKPSELVHSLIQSSGKRSVTARLGITNRIWPFDEWTTKPHWAPLLRTAGEEYHPRRKKPVKRGQRAGTGNTADQGNAAEARVKTQSSPRRQAVPRNLRKPEFARVAIANSGITRWAADRGRNKYAVRWKVHEEGTTGKKIVTTTMAQMEDAIVEELFTVIENYFYDSVSSALVQP